MENKKSSRKPAVNRFLPDSSMLTYLTFYTSACHTFDKFSAKEQIKDNNRRHCNHTCRVNTCHIGPVLSGKLNKSCRDEL